MIGCPRKVDVHNKYYTFEGLYEVLTSNFRGNLSHIGPEREELDCFHCTTLNFERKLPRGALFADRHPLRRDPMASRDRF